MTGLDVILHLQQKVCRLCARSGIVVLDFSVLQINLNLVRSMWGGNLKQIRGWGKADGVAPTEVGHVPCRPRENAFDSEVTLSTSTLDKQVVRVWSIGL
jgi:hypothetical protein